MIIKHLRSLIFITALTTGAFGQANDTPWQVPKAADYPKVSATAESCSGFIPQGFDIIKEISGDLNKDRLDDCVLVIKGTDVKFVYENDRLGSTEFDTNPRILIIAFRDANDGGFTLVEQNNQFIVVSSEPVMTEPFQGVQIKGGVVSFFFEEFYSAGSWGMSSRTYKFRYQKNEFTLIGLDYTQVQRNTGELTSISYNFLTHKRIMDKGRIDDDSRSKKVQTNIKNIGLKTLKTVPAPFTWEIEPDLIL